MGTDNVSNPAQSQTNLSTKQLHCFDKKKEVFNIGDTPLRFALVTSAVFRHFPDCYLSVSLEETDIRDCKVSQFSGNKRFLNG